MKPTTRLAIMLGTLISAQSEAALLTFAPLHQTVELGETVNVDIHISGLTGFDALGAFDLDLEFDDSILGFSGVSFGTQLDLFGFGSLQDASASGGVVDVSEVSMDLPFDLEDFQLDDFVLATIEFNADALGTSTLSYSQTILSDAWGIGFDPDLETGWIQVIAPTSVPEPNILTLLLLSAAGVAGLRVKKKNSGY
jgi:hypothetical protein